jgi:Molybdopterin-binding domain of aldehyde dehydrogenase
VERREKEVVDFNAANRYRKRGLCMMPVKFGISFTVKFMNQGGALVHVYTDGTVLVSHGGTEMGQGLHTKVGAACSCQCALKLAVHAMSPRFCNGGHQRSTACSVLRSRVCRTACVGVCAFPNRCLVPAL